tara:strand:- start:179 stop:724 length:546 start_codon:yes stop_codon:yes gene_type:complete
MYHERTGIASPVDMFTLPIVGEDRMAHLCAARKTPEIRPNVAVPGLVRTAFPLTKPTGPAIPMAKATIVTAMIHGRKSVVFAEEKDFKLLLRRIPSSQKTRKPKPTTSTAVMEDEFPAHTTVSIPCFAAAYVVPAKPTRKRPGSSTIDRPADIAGEIPSMYVEVETNILPVETKSEDLYAA